MMSEEDRTRELYKNSRLLRVITNYYPHQQPPQQSNLPNQAANGGEEECQKKPRRTMSSMRNPRGVSEFWLKDQGVDPQLGRVWQPESRRRAIVIANPIEPDQEQQFEQVRSRQLYEQDNLDVQKPRAGAMFKTRNMQPSKWAVNQERAQYELMHDHPDLGNMSHSTRHEPKVIPKFLSLYNTRNPTVEIGEPGELPGHNTANDLQIVYPTREELLGRINEETWDMKQPKTAYNNPDIHDATSRNQAMPLTRNQSSAPRNTLNRYTQPSSSSRHQTDVVSQRPQPIRPHDQMMNTRSHSNSRWMTSDIAQVRPQQRRDDPVELEYQGQRPDYESFNNMSSISRTRRNAPTPSGNFIMGKPVRSRSYQEDQIEGQRNPANPMGVEEEMEYMPQTRSWEDNRALYQSSRKPAQLQEQTLPNHVMGQPIKKADVRGRPMMEQRKVMEPQEQPSWEAPQSNQPHDPRGLDSQKWNNRAQVFHPADQVDYQPPQSYVEEQPRSETAQERPLKQDGAHISMPVNSIKSSIHEATTEGNRQQAEINQGVQMPANTHLFHEGTSAENVVLGTRLKKPQDATTLSFNTTRKDGVRDMALYDQRGVADPAIRGEFMSLSNQTNAFAPPKTVEVDLSMAESTRLNIDEKRRMDEGLSRFIQQKSNPSMGVSIRKREQFALDNRRPVY